MISLRSRVSFDFDYFVSLHDFFVLIMWVYHRNEFREDNYRGIRKKGVILSVSRVSVSEETLSLPYTAD